MSSNVIDVPGGTETAQILNAEESIALERLFENDLYETIGPCPHEGDGVHDWIFRAALNLPAVDESTAYRVIERATAKCGRDVPRREIEDAIRNARNEEGRSESTPKWPEKNQELIDDIAKCGPAVEELGSKSPVPTDGLASQQVVDALFPGDPARVLISVGRRTEDTITRPIIALRGQLDQMQFIVPNPMRALSGQRKGDGAKSGRCLDNTGPRRHIVVESDPTAWKALSAEEQAAFSTEEKYIKAKKDTAAAVLWHLAERAPSMPLVLVVDSGGKSLHGWFHVQCVPEGKLVQFFRYAVALGADKKMWTLCQFARMPGGLRDNGKRQSIIYFNPLPLTTL